MVDKTPQRLRVLSYTVLLSLFIAVVEEGAEETWVEVVQDESEEVLVELERVGELVCHLPHAVDELQENGRPIVVVVLVFAVADPVAELVPETKPLFLDEDLEPGQGSIVRIEKKHGQRGKLGGPVPSVRTVNNDRGLAVFNFVRNSENNMKLKSFHLGQALNNQTSRVLMTSSKNADKISRS